MKEIESMHKKRSNISVRDDEERVYNFLYK